MGTNGTTVANHATGARTARSQRSGGSISMSGGLPMCKFSVDGGRQQYGNSVWNELMDPLPKLA